MAYTNKDGTSKYDVSASSGNVMPARSDVVDDGVEGHSSFRDPSHSDTMLAQADSKRLNESKAGLASRDPQRRRLH